VENKISSSFMGEGKGMGWWGGGSESVPRHCVLAIELHQSRRRRRRRR